MTGGGNGAAVPRSEVGIFEVAPVSLWLEDYSGLKAHFEALRAAGIVDLRDYLAGDRARVAACSAEIRIVDVNVRTLALLGATDLTELTANLGRVFRDEMFAAHTEELVQLWNGASVFSSDTVNYRLDGTPLTVHVEARILPGYEESWERVLVAVEDVTAREGARRDHAAAASHAQGLFEHSPVSLWVEDFSRVKELLDDLRARGIDDLRVFTDVHPDFVLRCVNEIRVLDVNRRTLQTFAAPDKATLVQRLPEVFRDNMARDFREQLIMLWNGALFHTREVVNYSLDGTPIHFLLQFSVLPGHERTWSQVQIALTDITARKKAEAYLEYLGRHDVLTRLHNRSFYVDEMDRLQRKGLKPVSIVMADLDGLKAANDRLGHAAGDALLRRAGEVLGKAVDGPASVSRIGGDEFAILLPYTEERAAELLVAQIRSLVELNNQFYPGQPLRLSLGVATVVPHETIEAAARRADLAMYLDKRNGTSRLHAGDVLSAAE